MKLVVDIPDSLYVRITDDKRQISKELYEIIKNGTIIPEGHGRLIDASQLPLDIEYDDVENAPTIVEGDK